MTTPSESSSLRAGATPSPGSTEPVVFSCRPHPITILLRSLTSITLLLVYALLLIGPVRRNSGPDVAHWLLWTAIIVTALRILIEIARWLARRYTITRSEVTATDGILRRWHAHLPLDRIQHVVVHKTILERLFGLGTLGVSSAGGPDLVILWISIARPHDAAHRIEAARTTPAPAPTPAPTPNPAATPTHASLPTTTPPAPTSPPANPADPTSPQPTPPPQPDGPPPGRPGLDRPLIIGLAGGIGSGKSAVARFLQELGAAISDSDNAAKAMLSRDDVKAQLIDWWGDRILAPDGSIDRTALAAIIFDHPTQRRRLEALVHPLLKEGREQAKQNAWSRGQRTVVIDAPLLFEAGIQNECDEVWFVDAPRPQRLQRVKSTRDWNEAELTRRESAQLDLAEKRRRSTRIIPNDGDHADLRHHVRKALEAAHRKP